ncbi:hypothetical protein [Phenylobacterium sp.]|uniref:hypothetical protein n=1 Tax=Phenylobacterium sp. TaxID=1871053 RepID=UPI0027339AED|nr:hypothetical protein [Phenylobacterium sp.]MDP3852599.1 hypothetical protein [Phenylobacterium sp.]
MAQVDLNADLTEAAEEELERACSLGRRDMVACTPWGDTYEGYTPAGRDVCFERNYLWVDEAGGDICVEVVVYLPEAYEQGVRLTRTVGQEET